VKIRTQFFFLITGILLLPFLVIVLIGLVDYYRYTDRSVVPGYEEVSAISATPIDRTSWKRLSDFLSRKPPRHDYLIFDQDMVVLHSTLPEFPQRSRISDETLASTIRNGNEEYLFQFDKPNMKGDSDLIVMTRVLRKHHRAPDPIVFFFRTMLVVLASLFVFAGAMTIFIARSITASVTQLEESTRRIAEGELDLEINVGGSNEITSLNSSLNRMRLALKEEQARKSRFIMGITHDLKTPLALIKGYAEAITDGIADSPDSIARSLGIVCSKVDQLEGMIDDLIGFVKVDTGEWRQHLETRPIAPFLRSFAQRVGEDANLLGRGFSHEILVADSVTIRFDEGLLRRALENIANNAIRYTQEGGKIFMRATESPDAVTVTISDDGPGIPGEDLPRIFDLFFRGNSSRREEGMGLGLSIVKSIVASHDWKIEASSPPGGGATFTLIMRRDS